MVFRGENDMAVTTSLKIAEVFGKEHKHVVRDIDLLRIKIQDIDNQHSPNLDARCTMFSEVVDVVPIPNGAKKERRSYVMNRDGFVLLAMGYTGKKALAFKLRYIDAFNQMEQLLRNGAQSAAQLAQQQSQNQVELVQQMAQQMSQLCNTFAAYVGSTASGVVTPPAVPDQAPNDGWGDFTSSDGIVHNYRALRTLFPNHITVERASDLLRQQGIYMNKLSLFRYLCDEGYLSRDEDTYHRPCRLCVDKGWMVSTLSGTSPGRRNRKQHIPHLSPEFVEILTRRLEDRQNRQLEFGKEVQA